jgi:hypothetical protein
MAGADAQGNDYDNSIRSGAPGKTPAIDGTEGAIPASVPSRRRCGVRIVGHDVETGGWMVFGDRGTDSPDVTEPRDRS